MKLNILQKILSYLYPIKIKTAAGKTTPILGLYRFQGRWQLSSATALYSDGAAYRPLTTAFDYLRNELPGKKSMLVLGAGLGSAISVLQKMNISIPQTTLVDIDPQVIAWGKEIIASENTIKTKWICADVQDFVASENNNYDLIIIDIFQDRIVPLFVTSSKFLVKCKLLATQDATLVLNYIVNNEAKWEESLAEIKSIFTVRHIISIGINRILILKNSA